MGEVAALFPPDKYEYGSPEKEEEDEAGEESWQEQIKGFGKAWGELLIEFSKGCKAVIQQNFLTQDSYIVKKTRYPLSQISEKFKLLNEFLPEDRDPTLSCSVIFFVFILALAGTELCTTVVLYCYSFMNFIFLLNDDDLKQPLVQIVKRMILGMLLSWKSMWIYLLKVLSEYRFRNPDGRNIAYHEFGVSADRARYSIIVVHGFLFSRLAGIPGVKLSVLEEFGVRLISYDRPGYGESDPHPDRSLNSSAYDMLYLADAVGIKDKFWVLGYSDGAIHAWAALHYIPHRVAGAAMFSPLVNLYDSGITKEELSSIREGWTRRRRFMFFLARKCPKLLGYLYRRMFLSGKLGQVDKLLSLSLRVKDTERIGNAEFQELWQRNFAETIRQGSIAPLLQEAVLQVSHWGFTLADLQPKNICPGKGILSWLRSLYGQVECRPTGYRGPIHIWQGMDDCVIPPAMTEHVARVLPNTVVHKLPEEGHYSYLFFCEKCHKQIFSTLFGTPLGPLQAIDDFVQGFNTETILY